MNKTHQKLKFVENEKSIIHGKKRVMYARYICDCGRICIKRKADVNRNRIKSCGECLGHGMTGTRFYRIWKAMKTRTLNPNYVEYHLYGGKGVKLHDEWYTFENFKRDMFESYNYHVSKFGIKETTIDRTNGDGNYEPTNCRWATNLEQQNNKKLTIRYNYKGVPMTLKEVSDITGVPYATLYDRVRSKRPLALKKWLKEEPAENKVGV